LQKWGGGDDWKRLSQFYERCKQAIYIYNMKGNYMLTIDEGPRPSKRDAGSNGVQFMRPFMH